jgi:hypothetical protein
MEQELDIWGDEQSFQSIVESGPSLTLGFSPVRKDQRPLPLRVRRLKKRPVAWRRQPATIAW